MARLTGAIVGALLLAAALGGCTASSGDEPVAASASGTAAATSSAPGVPSSAPAGPSSASAAPSATAPGIPDRSDAALGIAFAKIPQIDGDRAEAVDALMQFQVEFWRSRIDGKVSPAIHDLATGAALAQVKDVVATNARDGWTTGGDVIDSFTGLAGSAHVVVVDVCADEREATYTKDAKVTAGADLDLARQAIRAEVARQPDGGWAVQSYVPGKSC